ncbi:hypothetical protein ABB37_03021 [Leptomonas pyrrhocoris]|uniref:Uncharacterized protein n=1 Tax=Leptomonas pyrrhocoris TaxID=157538 RepID=A0A0M9G6N1_LEPPY|nr:hypothetical protein ABB37_03021 [Leptomonas pyrrhocoris]KPA83376.1 hypothetical protein ABB37_03021 [Leptomonas pyrrhocoris]|eukprot:XP_015661815.1 hypothetical protein ABB37_03021 [Leptomonas pyrrhocoris]
MKAGGLAALLAQTVVAGDVNACCGVLRRIFSETLQSDVMTLALRAPRSPGRQSPHGPPQLSSSASSSFSSAVVSSQPHPATRAGKLHQSLLSSARISGSASVTSSLASASPAASSHVSNAVHNDVVNFARYAQSQRAQANSFANAAAQAVLRTAFTPRDGTVRAGTGEVAAAAGAAVGTSAASSPSPPAIRSDDTNSLVERVWALAKASLRDDPTLVKASSVQVLCHATQRTGFWQEALQFCEHLPRPPSPLFLSSLLRPHNVQPVLAHCAQQGWALDVTNAIRVLAEEHGSWSSALAVAQDAEHRFPYGEVYSLGVLIPYLAAGGDAAQARQLFESGVAQGALVDAALIQHLIMQTAALKQWETCLHMLQCLYRTQETAQLLPTDVDFFRQLMELSPSWVTSLRLLHIARASEVKPDERTVAILLTQCDKAGAWREAAAVYDMAVKEDFIDSLAVGSMYQTLVRSFSAMQQWQKALEALSWMSKAGDASFTAGMSELVTLCEQSGQWEAALTVGASLMESGTHLFSSQTSMALLFACAKGAQWAFAMRLFDAQLHDVRVNPHPLSLCAAMQACISARQWQAALRAYHEAQAAQPRTVVPPLAHRMAVKASVLGHQWSQAIAVLETMRQDGLPLDNNSQRLGLWAAALQGQWELSLAFLKGIPRRSRTPQDRLVVRNAARAVSPAVDAIALRLLQSR